MEKQLRKFPNIRRLKCRISDDPLKVMSFSFLSQLESLSLTKARLDSNELILPESIKKLTFLNCDLAVSFFSRITQQLPNLEVLKTRRCSFTGNKWHVEEGEFAELKILELVGMNIVKWTADSYDQFPNLEKLVLIGCDKLVEIPECLEYVATLKMIDVVRWQPGRVASLVKKVEECQKDWGTLVQVCVRNIGMDVFEDVEVSDKEDDVSEEVEVSDKEDRETWHGYF